MRCKSFALAACLVSCLCSSGCVATYPVVGYFNKHNELVKGTVANNLLTGTSKIRAEAVNSHVKGTGYATVTHIPNPMSVVGQRGEAVIDFEDGRRIEATYTVQGWIHGSGTGRDQDGNPVTFTFGMTEKDALAFIEQQKARVASNPSLPPVYKPKETRKQIGYSSGTGFFVSEDGCVVTSFHVIDDATEISITTKNGQTLPGKLIASDPVNDLALVRVECVSKPLPLVQNGTASKGQEVFTLGYPLIAIQGNEQKATFGRINALSGIQGDIRSYQIDVPVQPGNSGGPLIDSRGNVIGITSATLNQFVALRESGALPQNVNYAIKSDYLFPLVHPNLKSGVTPVNTLTRESSALIKDIEDSVVLVIAK